MLSEDAGRRIDPGLAPLLDELAAAWRDRDVPVARRLLAVLRSRTEDETVLAVADDYRRRLDGYELGQGLELALSCAQDEDDPTRSVVRLVATNRNPRPLELHLLTPTLERRVTRLSPGGLEARSRSDRLLEDFAPLALGPEARLERELGRFDRNAGGAIASRERYSLDPAGSWLMAEDELLPLPRIAVAPAERTGIAGYLPPTPLAPTHLIDYLGDARSADLPDEVFLPALLERAVRIPSAARREAVGLLAEAIDAWSDEQLARAAPALRWVTGALEPGGDPRAWRVWFASVDLDDGQDERGGRAAGGEAGARPDLVLDPDRR